MHRFDLICYEMLDRRGQPAGRVAVQGNLVRWKWHRVAETTMFKGLLPLDLIDGCGFSVSAAIQAYSTTRHSVTTPLAMT